MDLLGEQQPPPPAGTPPADNDDVYRPDLSDLNLGSDPALELPSSPKTEPFIVDLANTPHDADLLGVSEPERQDQSVQHSQQTPVPVICLEAASQLVSLEDPASTVPPFLAPPPVVHVAPVHRPPGQAATAIIDLSVPAPLESPDTAGAQSSTVSGPHADGNTSSSGLSAALVEATAGAVALLPDRVKDHIPETWIAGPDPDCGQAADPDRDQTEQAVKRACEGKWVPTYMRHQMAANGHTAVPQAPNAHEYDASAPPPSLVDALGGMVQELGVHAHQMLEMSLAVFSRLSLQCQLCTHSTVTTIHDSVENFSCEDRCRGGWASSEHQETEVLLGPFLSEVASGLGPLRSQVRRSMQGMSLEEILACARGSLATTQAPPEFRKMVKSRELVKQLMNHEHGVEDLLFSLEVNTDVLCDSRTGSSKETAQLLASSSGPLLCRERWHIEQKERRADVEITNEPSAGTVIVFLRIEIVERNDGAGCEVDSRLYARPRGLGAMLPPGLVERLMEAHHLYCERLRDLVLDLGNLQENWQSNTVGAPSGSELPVIKVPPLQAEKRPNRVKSLDNSDSTGVPLAATPDEPAPEPGADCYAGSDGFQQIRPPPSTLQKLGNTPDSEIDDKVKGLDSGVDNTFLLKVAEGI